MECEIDRWNGAASAVMRSLYRSVLVKKELSRKAKLSIYRSIYVLKTFITKSPYVLKNLDQERLQSSK